MATFTNQATLTFNGGSVTSNIVTGEIVETLTATKTAVTDTYAVGDRVTYVVSLVNSGNAALNALTVTDSLGAYALDTQTVYPLTYVDGSILYYQNGALQPTPTVTDGQPLTITGITVPAGGNTTLIYETLVNAFAPPRVGDTIVNTVSVTGGELTEPVIAEETITADSGYALSISKALSPAVIADNDTLTYTFVIENSGNTPLVATDDTVLSDTFNPILNPISVTYNGTPWTEGVNYTYDEATGLFTTLPGQISLPAATYTQNPDGTWTVTPGTATLVVSGTV